MKGHLQQRGPKTWRLYVELGRETSEPGPKQRRRQYTKTFHGSRRAAETALAQFVTEALAGVHDRNNDTFGALVENWYKTAAPSLTPNTLRGYRSKIDTHIIPGLGNTKLDELTAQHLDAFYGGLSTRLAPNTVRGIHAIIHAALEQAIRWDKITTNPASRTRRISIPEKDDPDLDPALVLKMLQDAPTETLGDIAWLAAITGLRVGELVGLRWGDLDMTVHTLAVRRRVMVDGTVRARTKNKRTRALGLDRRSVARLRLRHYRARQRAAMCEVELTDAAYIFSEVPDGLRPVLPGIISQRWTKHRTKMGVDLTFHGLRHFSASALLDGGHQLGRVSRRLGHTRQSTTADVYSHIMRADDHDLARDVAAKLREKRG